MFSGVDIEAMEHWIHQICTDLAPFHAHLATTGRLYTDLLIDYVIFHSLLNNTVDFW